MRGFAEQYKLSVAYNLDQPVIIFWCVSERPDSLPQRIADFFRIIHCLTITELSFSSGD